MDTPRIIRRDPSCLVLITHLTARLCLFPFEARSSGLLELQLEAVVDDDKVPVLTETKFESVSTGGYGGPKGGCHDGCRTF